MFGQTPEVLESELHECLRARTLSLPGFHSLGPADMVELQKTTKSKVSSTYHFVTGVDVSSAAAIAAYLTTLTSDLGENQLWFGRAPQWRVSEGTYCSWNAFSKIDVRVTAAFPGSTKMYVMTVDGLAEDGDSQDEELWRELYMSAMVRCLLLKDNDAYFMETTRHVFPFDQAGVKLFLKTFEALYWKGPLVGAGPWVQNPTLDCNYMVDALYKLLEATGMYSAAIEMLGRIEAKEVLAQVLLQGSQEVNAVGLLVNTVKKEPRNARMLALEAEFCLGKNKLDLALDCAKRAVAASPSDFYPWECLCKVYVALEQWDQALLALNSTPLIPLVPVDQQKLSQGKKVHCPLPEDGVLEEAWQFTADKSNTATAQAMSIDPALARLPGAQLRGSTERAFDLLATINSIVGWNELMRLRGEVFWMEAEGQDEDQAAGKPEAEQTAQSAEQHAATAGTAAESATDKSATADDVAAQDAAAQSAGDDAGDDSGNAAGDNTDKNKDDETKDASATGSDEKPASPTEEAAAEPESHSSANGATSGDASEAKNEEKLPSESDKPADGQGSSQDPAKAETQEEDISFSKSPKAANADASPKAEGSVPARRTLRSKRLCERRIDRLFLVLFEDVRAYSAWQREALHFDSQQLPFDKSALEWQVFGSLAQRLKHDEQAKRAYSKSLSMYFNHRALARELDYDPLNIEKVVKLLAWDHRWYNEFSPRLMGLLRKIVARDGLTKVRYQAEALFGKELVVDLVKINLDRLRVLKVAGWDM